MKLPVAAARVPLRQQRPLEVRALGLCAFEWGGAALVSERGDAILFFFRSVEAPPRGNGSYLGKCLANKVASGPLLCVKKTYLNTRMH